MTTCLPSAPHATKKKTTTTTTETLLRQQRQQLKGQRQLRPLTPHIHNRKAAFLAAAAAAAPAALVRLGERGWRLLLLARWWWRCCCCCCCSDAAPRPRLQASPRKTPTKSAKEPGTAPECFGGGCRRHRHYRHHHLHSLKQQLHCAGARSSLLIGRPWRRPENTRPERAASLPSARRPPPPRPGTAAHPLGRLQWRAQRAAEP
mmetsp:Transcript_10166/g.20113  ORF Transcript_10166/g.20113 Transcript_10166/m.20113 type:complete len:204 (-) Transcript_10166:303-914(-)